MRTEKKYNKVVNIENAELITMLNYTFEHDSSFEGATGSEFIIISKVEYKNRMLKKNIRENLSASGLTHTQIMEATTNVRIEDLERLAFDTSYWDNVEIMNELRKYFPYAYRFECIGVGRMFNENFQGNINPELSEIIRKFESK